MQKVNILSFDMEEWFQTTSCSPRISCAEWGNYASSIKEAVPAILRLLKDCRITATFFILGYNAARHPVEVKMIHDAGHEVAVHGYFHNPVDRLNKQQFITEISAAKKILEELVGGKMIGFRAPSWSINRSSLWALDILYDLGFKYDSSMDGGVYQRLKNSVPSGLLEISRSSFCFFNSRIPFGGGFFLRAFPGFVTKQLISYLNHRNLLSMIYIHQWEYAMDRPCVELSLRGKILHSLSLHKTRYLLEDLLCSFEFSSIKNIFFS